MSDVPAPRRGVPMSPNVLLFGVRAGLPREGERGTADPAGVAAVAESSCTRWRCGGDADRPAGGATFDLFGIVKQIVDAGGQFRSLVALWADTATSTGRLTIAVLGGLVDGGCDLIRTRTAEGRSRAKDRGRHMGRPPKLTPQQQAGVLSPHSGCTL